MAELAERFEFTVRWEPFLLRPDTPREGTPKPANFSDPNSPGVIHLKQAGKNAGIDFTFKSNIRPNTLMAHALLDYAKSKDGGTKQNDVAENLFKAYFTDGKSLDESSIVEAAQMSGLDVAEVKSYVHDENNIKRVQDKALSWSKKGVTGVPFFYINGHRMFSGAQESEVFKRMFDIAAEKFPVTPATSNS